MSSRRRSLIILFAVIALVGLSAWVIVDKPTKQGIDLRGGTELVYQARATPANPKIAADDVERAIEIIRDRVDTLGVAEPEISRVGADQISVSLPDVDNAEQAIEQVGRT